MTMKVSCKHKTFSPATKILEISLQLVVSVEAYLYAKNLTCGFESLWGHLSTSTWNDWINLLLLLISYHMQKTNFITHSWDKADSLFVITLDMFIHAWPHPLEAANYLLLSWTSSHIDHWHYGAEVKKHS